MYRESGDRGVDCHPCDLGTGGRIPDAGRAVVGGGDDAGAVGRERGAPHPILVPAQGGDLGAGGGAPEAGGAVVGGGDDAGAVGRERGAPHPILVSAQAAISAPVVASQRQAVRSLEAVTMWVPSGENAALSTAFS